MCSDHQLRPTHRSIGRSDYSFLSGEIWACLGSDDDGFYLYRHMLHPDLPNLVFVGRVSTFLSVATYCLQARWLAEAIAGRVQLPDREAMLAEIAAIEKMGSAAGCLSAKPEARGCSCIWRITTMSC
jgi:hypothetical protein